MHPVIAQAIATERSSELRVRAAAVARARQLRRSRHAVRPGYPGTTTGARRLYRCAGRCAIHGLPETHVIPQWAT